MYTLLITLHSYLRWPVVALLLAAAARAAWGWLGSRPYGSTDRRLGLVTAGVVDLQLLAGLGLYAGASPLSAGIFANFGNAMREPLLRFWAVEHLSLGLLAVIAVHLGRILARRADLERQRHQRSAIAFAVALALVLIAIPWPFREGIGRPWLRG